MRYFSAAWQLCSTAKPTGNALNQLRCQCACRNAVLITTPPPNPLPLPLLLLKQAHLINANQLADTRIAACHDPAHNAPRQTQGISWQLPETSVTSHRKDSQIVSCDAGGRRSVINYYMKSLLDLLQIIYAKPRAQTAHIKERSQMLRCYKFIALQAKRATEQRFRLKPESVYPVICMDRYNILVQQRVLKVSSNVKQIYTTFYYK